MSSADSSATRCASPTRCRHDTRIKLMTDGILLNEIHRDRDAAQLRHDHHRRGARAQPQRRLPARLPQAAAAAAPRPQGHHHLARRSTRRASRSTSRMPTAARPDRRGRAAAPTRSRSATGPLVAEAAEDDDDDGRRRRRPADDRDYVDGIIAALDELDREAAGRRARLPLAARPRSAMPRMPSRRVRERCRATEVLPLYGRLSAAEQHRVFERSTRRGRPAPRRARDERRRDEPHRARHPVRHRRRHRAHLAVQRARRRSSGCRSRRSRRRRAQPALGPRRAARATASRSGCTRRRTSTRRPEFTEPEILRTNLAAVILQMISLGLGDIAAFPFLQPPDSRGIKDGARPAARARRDRVEQRGEHGPRSPTSAASSRGCRSTRASRAC